MTWRPAKDLDPLNRLLVRLEQALLRLYRRESSLDQLLADDMLDALFVRIDGQPYQAALMSRIKSGHAMTPRHAINTLCLARTWAQHSHRLGEALHDFSLAALFHDLGHWRPDNLVYVFHYFTHEQARVCQKHPIAEAEEWQVLSARARRWIAQHHEQPDGKGYPAGLQQPEMLAQALRIVDVYDGLTTPRRFRPAYTPHRAMELMSRWAGFKFDRRLFRSFEHFWGRYPAGTLVHCKDGSLAVSLPPQGKQGLQHMVVLTNHEGDAIDEGAITPLTSATVDREAFSWHDIQLPENWRSLRPDLMALPRYYPT